MNCEQHLFALSAKPFDMRHLRNAFSNYYPFLCNCRFHRSQQTGVAQLNIPKGFSTQLNGL